MSTRTEIERVKSFIYKGFEIKLFNESENKLKAHRMAGVKSQCLKCGWKIFECKCCDKERKEQIYKELRVLLRLKRI